ncbi:hypothetical protein MM440_09955 [Arsenicicoccus piscis]|uniref:Heme exporter protein D n=1 Tax=Arsenicicoccus piscis TaxID=673954 RepID=A0ABQ6HPZ8_9MICO|nr:hypothetical protein [Arsenicicoccus piscis]MCH8628091.1 hypothetical protein [Arsenicicoccus piscis]GMA20546.1 hypothetical protein GCM10025862_25670 [Arsenicicoccus piscis]
MNPGGPTNTEYSLIGPGFAAFVAFFVLAIALYFLVRSMNGHLRRVAWQQRAEEEAQAALEAGTTEEQRQPRS